MFPSVTQQVAKVIAPREIRPQLLNLLSSVRKNGLNIVWIEENSDRNFAKNRELGKWITSSPTFMAEVMADRNLVFKDKAI